MVSCPHWRLLTHHMETQKKKIHAGFHDNQPSNTSLAPGWTIRFRLCNHSLHSPPLSLFFFFLFHTEHRLATVRCEDLPCQEADHSSLHAFSLPWLSCTHLQSPSQYFSSPLSHCCTHFKPVSVSRLSDVADNNSISQETFVVTCGRFTSEWLTVTLSNSWDFVNLGRPVWELNSLEKPQRESIFKPRSAAVSWNVKFTHFPTSNTPSNVEKCSLFQLRGLTSTPHTDPQQL